MRRAFVLSAAALVAAAVSGWAAGPCCNHGIHCTEPPPPDCPDCGCPCDHGLHHCSAHKSEHAHNLIAKLGSCDCCERIHAAQKLGHHCHADFCCDPEVLAALVHALQCDSCWEVRRAAAWSIEGQHARTTSGVLALYVASKLDPHYLVREKAAEALDILLVCRRDCFTAQFKAADELIKTLKGKYKPGSPDCGIDFGLLCGGCGVAAVSPPVAPAAK